MIELSKLKKINVEFPVMFAEKALSNQLCTSIIEEIKNSRKFDDLIQGGRNRINKGSNNFKEYLLNSKNSKKIYEYFNRESFYKKIETIFKKNFKNSSWHNSNVPKEFLKKKFTNKKLMNSNELIKMFSKNHEKPKVNLDMDFSVSKGGYRLRPHRDDITRIYNFLIYLNNIPKKNGGTLVLYKKKTKKIISSNFKRFPKFAQLSLVKEFVPKQGSIIFFQSTPNSYHGVKRFKEQNGNKRYFIYGSYAQSIPVVWNYKNVKYLPVIKKTNKKMLTSRHQSNYKLQKAG